MIAFLGSTNAFHEHDLGVPIDLCVDSILVSFDLEYDSIVSQKARVWVSLFDVTALLPFRFFHLTEPSMDLVASLPVPFAKFIQSFSADHSHRRNVPILGST